MIFKLLAAAVLLFSLCLACKNDNPLSPYEAAEISDYLPLDFGYKVKYEFIYNDYQTDESAYFNLHSIKGICEIAVQQFLRKDLYVYSRVSSTFYVDTNKRFRRIASDSTTIERNNYIESRSFDLLQSKDSLWYITDAPSFFELDKGLRSLMLCKPIEDQNYLMYLNLKLFTNLFEEFNYSKFNTVIKGDTLVYTPDFAVINPSWGIRFLKNHGLVNINWYRYRNAGTNITGTTFEFKEIE